MEQSYNSSGTRRLILLVVALALIAAILLLFPVPILMIGPSAYLPLHTAMESLTVGVALLVFATGINSYQGKIPFNLMLLSCAFLAIGLTDFGHILSYAGMPDFVTPSGPEKAIYFWLAARAMAALSLLAVALLPWRRLIGTGWQLACLAITLIFTAVVYGLILFHQDSLPRVFIHKTGLTPFKDGAEYLIVGIHMTTALFFYRHRRLPQPYDADLLLAAVCIMGLGELFFAAYNNVTDLLNLSGHLYKVVGYLLIYRAIFVYNIRRPYLELRKAEERLERGSVGSYDGFWDCDLRTGAVEYSVRWAEMLGHKPEEIEPHSDSWKSRIHPDDLERVLREENDYIEGKAPAYDTEFRMRAKSGEWRWIRSRGKITERDADGRALRISGAHTDITGRKRSEQEIARLERRNTLILQAAGKGICGMDIEGRITFINPMGAGLLGYTVEEIAGLSLHAISHYQKVDGTPYPVEECPIQSAVRNGTSYYEHDELFWRKDGTSFPVEYTCTPIMENEKADGAVLVFSDTTERKQAEYTLHRWQQFVEHTTWGMAIGEFESRTIGLVNPAFARMHGYTVYELLGMPADELYAPESRTEIPNHHEALRKAGRLSFECIRLRKDGSTFPALIDIAVVHNTEGKADNYLVNVQDITRRKQAEKLLLDSEERFRTLFGSIQDAIFVVPILPDGMAGKFLEVNEVACRLLGYSREELLDKTIADIDDHEAGIDPAPVIKRLMAGESAIFEQVHISRDGRRIPVEVNANPFILDGRPVVMSLVRDISERKRLTREAEEAHRQLRDLSAHLQTVREEEKANVAREIHDDLGGTLTALKMDVYWLERNIKSESQSLERTASMSNLLDNAVEATRRIITQLRPSILDDLGLLAAVEWQAAQFQKRTGIRCRVQCSEDRGELDKAHAVALFRIFQEALTNITRHAGATQVEVVFHLDDKRVSLSVCDNGCGLAENQVVEGTSYGIRGMCERASYLGGQVKFDTPPGGGLSVTVSLPLSEGGGVKE